MHKPHLQDGAAHIALLYVIFAGAWILLSDSILALLIPDAAALTSAQTYKGWGFVVVTACLLYAERARADTSLRASESRYRLIAENTDDVIWTLDLATGKFTFISASVEKLRGYTPDEVLNQTMAQALTPASLAFVNQTLPDRLAAFSAGDPGARVWTNQVDQMRKDGSIVPTEVVTTLIANSQGQVTEIVGVTRDITERKRAEEALQFTTRQLTTLLEHMQAGILFEDSTRHVALANQAFCNLFSVPIPALALVGADCRQAAQSSKLLMADPEGFVQRLDALVDNYRVVIGEELNLADGRIFERDYIPVAIDEHQSGNLWQYRDITDRKRAEERLRESEAKFRALFDQAGYAIGMAKAGVQVMVNQAYLELFGYHDVSQVVGHSLLQDIAPEERPRLQGNSERRSRGEPAPTLYETRGIRRDGTIFDMDVRATTYELENEVYTIGIVRDITDRKRAEEALQESRARLDLALRSANMGVWHLNIAENKRYFDDQVCRLLGIDPSAFTGTAEEFFRKIHPDDHEALRAALTRTIEQGALYDPEYRVIWSDKSIHHIRARGSLIRDGAGQPLRVYGIIWDVSERKRSEETMRQLSRAVEQNPATIVITDTQGNIEYANPKFTETTGYTLGEALGKNPRLLRSGHTPPEEYKRLWETITAGREWRGEFHNRKKNGELYWESAVLSPILDERGKITHFIAIKEDITERKHAEAALRESESILRKSQTVARLGSYRLEVQSGQWSSSPMLEQVYGIGDDYSKNVNGWLDLIHPDQRSEMQAYLTQHVLAEHHPFEKEFLIIRPHDLQERWVFGTGELEFDAMGNPSAVFGTVQDITDRKRAEMEINEHATRAESLARFASRLNAQIDLNAVLTTLCEESARALKAPAAVVSLYEPDRERMTVTVVSGLPADYVTEHIATSTTMHNWFNNPLGRTFVIPDIRTISTSPNRELHTRLNLCTMANSSIVHEGQLVGCIAILTYEPREFSALDLGLLSSLADEAALAIANARSYQRELARNSELDALLNLSQQLRQAQRSEEMLSITLCTALQILQADAGVLVLYQPNLQRFKVVLASGLLSPMRGQIFGIDESIGGMVYRTRQPYVTADLGSDPTSIPVEGMDQLGPAVFVPLQSEVEFLGVIVIVRHRKPEVKCFSATEIHLASTIGEMAGNTLRRTRLNEDLHRRLEQLQSLNKVDTIITSNLDLPLTIQVFLDEALARLGVDAGDILLASSKTHTLEYGGGRGFQTNALVHTRLRFGEGFAGQAALERRIIEISNLVQQPDGLTRSTALASEGFVTYYAMPLMAKGEVKGVLELFNRKPIKLEEEGREFLNALALQGAIAIDNATLFSDLQKSNVELAMAYDDTILGWSRALDLRDRETHGHTARVTDLTIRLARRMELPEEEIVHLRRGGLLHDIGKMGVPDAILLKPDKLNEEEWQAMRTHPELAFQMLLPIAYLKPALDVPYCHHEKWDGSGYPRRLKGEQIPVAARLFAIVDVWDALTSDRPYRKAWTEDQAVAHIQSESGKHFDPRVVNAFFEMLQLENGKSK